MPENELTPCAKWSPDCQGKWDYDGSLISISCRYWPAGGGFHVLNADAGTFEEIADPSIKPSAVATITLNHGEPGEYGFGDYSELAKQEFNGDTEAEVKAKVEAWVADKFTVVHEAVRVALDA